MGFIKIEYWENGNEYTPVNIYKCDNCKDIVLESDRHYMDSENIYCIDCAFKLRKINEEQYVRHLPICLDNVHADIIDGEIVVWIGNIHPLDKKRNSLDRRCKRYRDWRKEVFERDNYCCQICNSEKKLEAHHIKEFSKYKKLRFDVSNGITLCKKCHIAIHRKR